MLQNSSEIKPSPGVRALHARGLKRIPEEVRRLLPGDVLDVLSKDGHGLSFPEKTGCQMRIIRNGKDLGGFFSYRAYGGVRKAIAAAMSRNQQVRALYRQKRHYHSKTDFCYLVVRDDLRKGKVEWLYSVNYRKGGKVACKSFSMGHKQPSASKQMHAYLTAKLFRFYYEELGENFDESIFTRWKHCRLYLPGEVYFDWQNT